MKVYYFSRKKKSNEKIFNNYFKKIFTERSIYKKKRIIYK